MPNSSRFADYLGVTSKVIENDKLIGYSKNVSVETLENVKVIFKSKSVKKLVEQNLLVGHTLSDKSLDSQALVSVPILFSPVHFRNLPNALTEFIPSELPLSLIYKCSKAWIAINLELLQDGLCLVDAHLFNFAFDKNLNAIWIDLGSIKHIEHGLEGISEFRAIHEYTIKAISRNPALRSAFRALLSKSGVTRDGWRKMCRIPIVSVRNSGLISGLIRVLQLNLSTNSTFPKKFSRIIRWTTLHYIRFKFSREFVAEGYWKKYSNRTLSEIADTVREETIVKVAKNLNWKTCLDLAGSDGNFLCLISGMDKQLYLSDLEETGLKKFLDYFASGSAENCQHFARVESFEDATGEYDLVLALAITHHLTLSQFWTFEGISRKLSFLTRKHLLVEYMPLGVGKYQTTLTQLPNWYTEDKFIEALENSFQTVTRIGEFEGRVLFLASKGFE